MNTNRKHLLIVILVVLAASILCLSLYTWDNKYTHKGNQPIAGTLFVNESDAITCPVRYLWNGWNFYPDVLLTPETYDQRDGQSVIPVQIGAHNNFAFGNPNRPVHGCGTYALTLQLPDTPHTYSIELPEVFSAYRFYVNDQLMLQMGDPDAQSYQDSVQNRTATFTASNTVRLLLAVRDESHIYSGMVYPPAFGEPLAVNTVRAIRVCMSVAVVTTTLLCGLLALWLSLRAYQRRQNAQLFLLLCLSTSIFLSYFMVHGILPLPIQPWYTVELVSGHLVTLLLLLLHSRICQTNRTIQTVTITAAGIFCLLVMGYGLFAAQLTQPVVALFSKLEVGFKLSATLYLLVTALLAIRREVAQAEPIFYADIFYSVAFLFDSLLPSYEPILSSWFQEWGCLVLVATLGFVLWRDVARGYRRSFIFAEEQRQMQHQLEIQQEHYRQISEKIEESRRQRHDFRQHLRTIASLADQPEAQAAYIGQITTLNESSQHVTRCHDSAVDALLYYYISAAQKQDIDITVQVELPEQLELPSVAFCTILGNLLENAMEACQRQQSGEKKIDLHIKWQFQKIYLVLRNTYDGQIDQQHGRFLSRKHPKAGLGTESVRELTRRLNGTVQFQPDKHIFQVILILPVQSEEPESESPF